MKDYWVFLSQIHDPIESKNEFSLPSQQQPWNGMMMKMMLMETMMDLSHTINSLNPNKIWRPFSWLWEKCGCNSQESTVGIVGKRVSNQKELIKVRERITSRRVDIKSV